MPHIGRLLCVSFGPAQHAAPLEGAHDRCLQLWLGSSAREQTGIQLLVKPGAAFTHQLPQDDGPKNLPVFLKGYHVLVPLDNMIIVTFNNHLGGLRSY